MKRRVVWHNILLTVLLLCILGDSTHAVETQRSVLDSGVCGDNLTWALYDDGELVISGEGEMWDAVLGVSPWQSKTSYIKKIVVEHGVTNVGSRVFEYCHNLQSVSLPDTLISIGAYAFRSCGNLLEIRIPDSVTAIGDGCFSSCDSLVKVYLSESMEYIGDSAFYSCNALQEITIPAGVSYIGEGTFRYCKKLMAISVDEGSKDYCSDAQGVLFNKDRSCLIQYPSNSAESIYQIPDGVSTIAKWAFAFSVHLTQINIPNSVNKIEEFAFSCCSGIQNIVLPDGITAIEEYTFARCSSLQSIYIPNGVTDIGNAAFSQCTSLQSIYIPGTVSRIGEGGFSRCSSLLEIAVSAENEYYSNDGLGVLFDKDKTTLVLFPAGNSASFYQIPDSVSSIGVSAFSGCINLQSVVIPDSVSSIGVSAFSECINLHSVSIAEGITSIDDATFSGDENLDIIAIPKSVTSINFGAFYGCDGLVLYIPNSVEQIGKSLGDMSTRTICGYTDSAAYNYAMQSNIPFFAMDKKTVKGIEIYSLPCRLGYTGDTPSFTGLTVLADFGDKKFAVGDYDISYTVASNGLCTVTVSYLGCNAQFEMLHIEEGNLLNFGAVAIPDESFLPVALYDSLHRLVGTTTSIVVSGQVCAPVTSELYEKAAYAKLFVLDKNYVPASAPVKKSSI